jgi:hypothetical protein
MIEGAEGVSRKRAFLGSVQRVAMVLFLTAGCGSKNDAINQAEKI